MEAMARRILGNRNSTQLAAFLRVLGHSRVGMGSDVARFARAEEDLLEAHAMLGDASGSTESELTSTKQALMDLYALWDAAEPGKGYGARAKEWGATR